MEPLLSTRCSHHHQQKYLFPLENKDGTEELQVAASFGQLYRRILMPNDIWRPGIYKSVIDLGKFLARECFNLVYVPLHL